MDEKDLIREAMRALGSRKSPAKTISCRENAKRSWTPEARAKRKSEHKKKVCSTHKIVLATANR